MNKHEIIAKFKVLIDEQDEDALDAFADDVWLSPVQRESILSIYLDDDGKITLDVGEDYDEDEE